MGNTSIRESQNFTFKSHDDTEIFYRYWPSVTENDRSAVVLFHRGHEHGARMAHLVDELDLPNQAFFAWDARGHGNSPGARGDSPSFACSVRDIQSFMDHIKEQYNIASKNISIIAQSVGAVLACTWVHDYAPELQALILASPAFKIKLYIPFAQAGLRLVRAIRGDFFINSYVRPRALTHDIARRKSYEQDPLISRPVSANMLLGLYDAAKRVVQNAQTIHTPTQLWISGSDFVVRRKPQLDFFSNLSSTRKEQHILPGFFHDTLGEKERAMVIKGIKRFIVNAIEYPVTPVNLKQSHLFGSTCAESEMLNAAFPKHTWQYHYWNCMRKIIRWSAKYSQGIKTGIDTGFDSGTTLDYIYQNQPNGQGKIGRLVDQQYLNAIGWRGIRQRKHHLEELLIQASTQLRQENLPVHILDVAAGHGRYILDAVKQIPEPDSILLRDYSELNIQQGQALIEQRQLTHCASFEKGDAFHKESIALLKPKTLAVVSGLYELFEDNDAIAQSLSGIAQALSNGGYLLYTNQPWHPQLEFIARALTSHRDGQPWVMRRRSQAEMDQLVQEAGFEKIAQRIDPWGIFTVCLAQKI